MKHSKDYMIWVEESWVKKKVKRGKYGVWKGGWLGKGTSCKGAKRLKDTEKGGGNGHKASFC